MSARDDRLLLGADLDARAFKPSDWRGDDPRAGTVAGNNSLDSQIARARREMGPDKWQRLNDEWNSARDVRAMLEAK